MKKRNLNYENLKNIEVITLGLPKKPPKRFINLLDGKIIGGRINFNIDQNVRIEISIPHDDENVIHVEFTIIRVFSRRIATIKKDNLSFEKCNYEKAWNEIIYSIEYIWNGLVKTMAVYMEWKK